jgi:hypothetical protein
VIKSELATRRSRSKEKDKKKETANQSKGAGSTPASNEKENKIP